MEFGAATDRAQPGRVNGGSAIATLPPAVSALLDAIAHYEQGLVLRPGVAEAHDNLAVLLETAGRPEEAILHYRAALAVPPDRSDAADNLTRLPHELGRHDETPGIAAPLACDPASAEASGHRGAAP